MPGIPAWGPIRPHRDPHSPCAVRSMPQTAHGNSWWQYDMMQSQGDPLPLAASPLGEDGKHFFPPRRPPAVTQQGQDPAVALGAPVSGLGCPSVFLPVLKLQRTSQQTLGCIPLSPVSWPCLVFFGLSTAFLPFPSPPAADSMSCPVNYGP